MKNNITIILFLFLSFMVFGQQQNKESEQKEPVSKPDKYTPKPNSNDSIYISIQQFDEIATALKDDNSLLKNILPSIIALIVVFISTWGAIHIGREQIKVQVNNGEEQLRSQESQAQEQLIVAREQIQESSKTTLKQINSTNRQTWVIDTRNTLSELMTQANLLNIEFQEKSINLEKQKIIHEKFLYTKNKLFLLLTPSNEIHKKLLDSLKELMNILDDHLINSRSNNDINNKIGMIKYDNIKFKEQLNSIIGIGRDLLYEEWGKIQ